MTRGGGYAGMGGRRGDFGDDAYAQRDYGDEGWFREDTGAGSGGQGMGGGFGRSGRSNFGGGNSDGSMGGYGQGPHTGRGPRGYRRSDDRIREDVNEELERHGWLDATDVEVEVHEGEVTLRGTVEDRSQKRMAEDAAERVTGVKDVRNELRIKGRGSEHGEEHGATVETGHSTAGGTTVGSAGNTHVAAGHR
jgi:hypothetical protein